MEKERGSIRFIETDDGYRIEVTGKSLKEAFSCCSPMMAGFMSTGADCCEPSRDEGSDCCGSGKKKE